MLYAKTTLVNQFRKKIHESVHMLIMLMEMTTLQDDHMALNIITYNWLSNIVKVFEESDSKFEQKKAILEDRMKMGISNLNEQIETMFSR